MHPDQSEAFAEVGVNVPSEPSPAVIFSGRKMLTYGIPKAYKDLAYELASSDKTRSFMLNELRNLKASMNEVKPLRLSGIPVRLVSHGRRDWDRLYKDGRMEDIWTHLQHDLRETHHGAEVLVATRAGHQIPLDAPETVSEVVVDLVRIVRRSANAR